MRIDFDKIKENCELDYIKTYDARSLQTYVETLRECSELVNQRENAANRFVVELADGIIKTMLAYADNMTKNLTPERQIELHGIFTMGTACIEYCNYLLNEIDSNFSIVNMQKFIADKMHKATDKAEADMYLSIFNEIRDSELRRLINDEYDEDTDEETFDKIMSNVNQFVDNGDINEQ